MYLPLALCSGNLTCHKHCLGGCVNATESGCFRCAGMHLNGTCVDSCPPHLFFSEHVYGCVDEYACWKYNTIPMDGECKRNCPDGTSHVVDPRKDYDLNFCHPCPNGRCLRVCQSQGLVEAIAQTQYYRDCQVLNGSLLIRLSNEHRDIRSQLLLHFRAVEQILGTLEVHNSSVLPDLSFLRNLQLIDPLPEQLLEGKWALRIWNNRELKVLFDWHVQPDLVVAHGEVAVMDNVHLCSYDVPAIYPHVKVNGTNNWTIPDVLLLSNGQNAICVHRPMDVQVYNIQEDRAQARWLRFVPALGYKLLGYWVHHRMAEDEMVEYGDDMDTCAE